MPRFFLDHPTAVGERVTLLGDDAHHISYALRMAAGEEITVTDSEGKGFLCRLSALDGVSVSADVISQVASTGESPVRVHLFQAYPKSDKLEFIIQKAVELGAFSITPFESDRCIKRPKAEKVAHQLERQKRIALEAAKQCGRDVLPEVKAPISFDEMLSLASSYPLALFAHPSEATVSVRRILESEKAPSDIAIVVGSEGGFSEEEFLRAKAAGLLPTSLGARVLRCETAPLFLLSAISYAFELAR